MGVGHLDASVINQDIVHLEVGILTSFICVIAQKSIAQTVPSLLVPDDVARGDVAKAAKNSFQIFLCRHLVQLGNEQHVGRRFGVCLWQITDHFKDNCSVLGLRLPTAQQA